MSVSLKSNLLRIYGTAPGAGSYTQQVVDADNQVLLNAGSFALRADDTYGSVLPVRDIKVLQAQYDVLLSTLQSEVAHTTTDSIARDAQEAAAREAADTAVAAAASSALSAGLADSELRDTALGGRIDTEVADRIAGDAASVSTAHDDAVQLVAADNALWHTAISDASAASNSYADGVVSSVSSQVLTLSSQLSTGLSDSESRDTALGARIDAEVADRIAGDAASVSTAHDDAVQLVAADNALWQAAVSDASSAANAYADGLVSPVSSQVSTLSDQLSAEVSDRTVAVQGAKDYADAAVAADSLLWHQGDADTLDQARVEIAVVAQSVSDEQSARTLADEANLASAEATATSIAASAAAASLVDSKAYSDAQLAVETQARIDGDLAAISSANSYTDGQIAPVSSSLSTLSAAFSAFSTGTDPAALATFIAAVQSYQQLNPDTFVQIANMQRVIGNIASLLLSMTGQDVTA